MTIKLFRGVGVSSRARLLFQADVFSLTRVRNSLNQEESFSLNECRKTAEQKGQGRMGCKIEVSSFLLQRILIELTRANSGLESEAVG